MSFKQLASLRDQLAQQAKASKDEKKQKKEAEPKKKSDPADPVLLVIRQLQNQFPKAFPKNPAPKVPLKLGIHKDLFELSDGLGISNNALREAIKTWCCGNRYWASIVEDAVRLDLSGNAAGSVTKDEAVLAKKLKNRHHKKNKPKIASSATEPC